MIPPLTPFLALILMNLFDGLFTIYWVGSGHAIEANPLMAEMIEKHWMSFFLIKMFLVNGGLYILWKRWDRTTAKAALFMATLSYSYVMYIHLAFALSY